MAGRIQTDVFQHLGVVRQAKFARPMGLYCFPSSEEFPSGWGAPFTDQQGNPINPPLGTPAGGNPYVLLRKNPSTLDVTVRRGVPLPLPEDYFDWRGLESSPGAGDMPFMHFKGPRTRYFPFYAYAPGFSFPQKFGFYLYDQEITESLYGTDFYYRGRLIAGPGPKVKGGCVFDQGGADPHFVVVTGDHRSMIIDTSSQGESFWKRPVNDSQAPWELIELIRDPIADIDVISFPTKTFHQVPWHFNANGDKAITTVLSAGQADGQPRYDGLIKYIVDITLTSVTITTKVEDGNQFVSSVSRTYDNTGGTITRTQTTTSNDVRALVAADFEYPGDTVVDVHFTQLGSSSFIEHIEFCGATCPKGTSTSSGTGNKYEVGTQSHEVLTGPSDFSLLAGSFTQGEMVNLRVGRSNAWDGEVWGADLRYRFLGMTVPLSNPEAFGPAGDRLCNCYDNNKNFIVKSVLSTQGWTYIKMWQRLILFGPDSVQTLEVEDDRRALFSFTQGGELVSQGLPWQPVLFLDFPPSETGDPWAVFLFWNLTTNFFQFQRGPKQMSSLVGTGGLVVDRFGKVFYSYQFSDDHFGSARFFIASSPLPLERNVQDHLDPETFYEYEGEDIDALVGTEGTRRKYHPLEST